MLARKILITKEIDISELHNVIKKSTLKKYTDIELLERRARKKANSVVTAASNRAKRIVQKADVDRKAKVAEGYHVGMKDAQKELAVKMTELSAVSSEFMNDIELRIVDIVFSSLSEIINSFDDRVLVEEVVRKSAKEFQSCGAVTLWVSPNLKKEFKVGIEQLVAPASLSIKGDENLEGGQCRIDNGRMVVVGDAIAQVECIKVALKNRISIENGTV